LNLSELDGWWAEAYTPEVGWALSNGEQHHGPEWDAVEAGQLYRLLEQEIVPAFYARDKTGVPREWVKRIRTSMDTLTPRFSTNRMVREYVEQIYLPAATAFARRSANQGNLAKQLHQWEMALNHAWHEIHLGQLVVSKHASGWTFNLHVYLGAVSPDAIQVQLYADPQQTESAQCLPMLRDVEIPGVVNGYIYKCKVNTARPYADFTPRLLPYHPEVRVPAENPLIAWWSGELKLTG